jgi:hypothetical protein
MCHRTMQVRGTGERLTRRGAQTAGDWVEAVVDGSKLENRLDPRRAQGVAARPDGARDAASAIACL